MRQAIDRGIAETYEMKHAESCQKQTGMVGWMKRKPDDKISPDRIWRPAVMWKCPKCGREFKNTNQDHYCGEKPKTIEEYIMRQDEEKQADLFLIRQTLRQAFRCSIFWPERPTCSPPRERQEKWCSRADSASIRLN